MFRLAGGAMILVKKSVSFAGHGRSPSGERKCAVLDGRIKCAVVRDNPFQPNLDGASCGGAGF